MSIRLILFLGFIVIWAKYSNIKAQHYDQCGQAEATEKWFHEHPEDRLNFQLEVEKINKLVNAESNNEGGRSETLKTIPVVFHILHEDGPENISNEQIYDQIRILNRDFQKLNADTSNVVAQYKDRIGNPGFAFKLASIDPDGNCTDGIQRHFTKLTNWEYVNHENYIYTWPSDQYLNIYVVKSINGPAAAYTYLPGTDIPKTSDAIVSIAHYVGSIGTSSVANSRVITHEVGHWFGLPHVWGFSNSPGIECGDDFVDDTPITKGFTSCSLNASQVCNPGVVENVQNYMDYANCKLMFTAGQAARMNGVITANTKGRGDLISEANLIRTGVVGENPCKTVSNFVASTYFDCIRDSIKFTNLSKPGKGTYDIYWHFEGGVPSISKDSVVNVSFEEEGLHDVTLIISSLNGSDTVTQKIRTINGLEGIMATHVYDFEEETFPSDLEIFNPQSDEVKWGLSDGIGANNTRNSIVLPNSKSNNTAAYEDYFETPFFDLTNVSKPAFSYYYAYAKKMEEQNDTFKIEYTTDCGGTWQILPTTPNTSTMSKNTGGTRSDEFIPTQDQWRKVSITSLFRSFFKNVPSVKFRFYFKSDHQTMGSNNLFLDEITVVDEDNINTSAEEIQKHDFDVFPNPTHGHLMVSVDAKLSKDISIEIYNSLGQLMNRSFNKTEAVDKNLYSINKDLEAGIYFVNIYTAKYKFTKKLVVF